MAEMVVTADELDGVVTTEPLEPLEPLAEDPELPVPSDTVVPELELWPCPDGLQPDASTSVEAMVVTRRNARAWTMCCPILIIYTLYPYGLFCNKRTVCLST